MSIVSSDVVIIGSGVIGASVALELARDGWSVTCVDRAGGPGQGSTSASSAVIRFNYSTWTGVVAAWEAKHHWENWQNHLEAPDAEALAKFHRIGCLVFDSPNQDRQKVLALFDRARIPYEIWDSATIRARMPHLDLGSHYPPKRVTDDAFWDEAKGELTGYWTPDSGFVDDPALAAHNLMSAARRRGATFRFGATVTAVHRSADRVTGVQLDDGTRLTASVVVNVAGPHSGHINKLAGVGSDFSIHTKPLRQEVHEIPAPPGVNVPAPLVTDLDLGTYSRGTPSGKIIVGGTEPECDPLHWLNDPDDAPATVSREVYEAQSYRLARRMPEVKVPNTPRGIVGVYDVTDDWVPIYDRTELPGFYVAIGTSGNQFKNAPVVGRFMAEIIKACEDGQDHDREPVQVPLPLTGHVADMQHYSRRRTINSASSFSVMG
jgi:sarcosine oxidase subunit beta